MTDRAFIDECIKTINDYRRNHQVAPLNHNSAVSTIAQRWADHMARTGSFGHNPNASYSGQPLGENCAFKYYSDRRNITGTYGKWPTQPSIPPGIKSKVDIYIAVLSETT